MVCLTNLLTKYPPMPPKLNRRRALEVLSRIDQILAWEARHENERDTKFVELGKYLCEVRAGQYWRLEKLKSFDEFLERRFPESRRKAYYLMSIHEHLPPQVRRELKQVGWTKGLELAKLARHQGQRFESATWLHKARQMPKAEFQREVEKELTGKDSEPSELIYFKVYQEPDPGHRTGDRDRGIDARLGQVPRLLPGDDLCRFYRRGQPGRQPSGDPTAFALPLLQVPAQSTAGSLSLRDQPEGFMKKVRSQKPATQTGYDELPRTECQVLERDGWRCQTCGSMQHLQVHHLKFRSHSGCDEEQNLITLCTECHEQVHRKAGCSKARLQ